MCQRVSVGRNVGALTIIHCVKYVLPLLLKTFLYQTISTDVLSM